MYNSFLWKKAYILEFYKNNILQDAFAFSVPPQNEEFVYPQRVAETKTFGSVVFDDYGNDTIKISLSGTTINDEFKYIYRGKLPHKNLTGTEEIFYLKDLIEKYGRQDNLKGKKVVCYSLDNDTKEYKYFNVVINELKIHRSKENPFAYFYNLQMTSYPEKKEDIKELESLAEIKKLIDKCKEKAKNLESVLEPISESMGKLKNDLASLNKSIDDFVDVFATFENIILGTAEEITGFVETITTFGNKVIASGRRLTIGTVVDLYNSAIKMRDNINTLSKDLISLKEEDLPQEIMEIYQKDDTEIKDLLVSQTKEVQNTINETTAAVKRSNNTQTYTLIPGNSTTDDRVVTVHGFKEKTVKENETFDSIAAEIYGDPSLGVLIQMYNKSERIKAGDAIYLPILDKTENITTKNQIYNVPSEFDSYGVDVDFQSNMSFFNNDFTVVKKEENLDQAIAARLTTILNSRVRNLVYGIQSEVGNSNMSSNYILASIKKTLEEEPRIKEIENISFSSSDGSLNIKVEYKDINDFTRMWGGSI